MQIQTTTNYDQFRSIDANRKVDPAHVRKLAASIDRKNMLPLRAKERIADLSPKKPKRK